MKLSYALAFGVLMGPALAHAGNLSGVWVNADGDTRGLVRLVIDQQEDGAGSMIALAACVPTECDWGVTAVNETDGSLRARFDQEHKSVELVLQPLSPDTLQVREVSTYNNTVGRQLVTDYIFNRDANNGNYKIRTVGR